MNILPLQTYCVGRLLVDLPKQATFSWTQEFDDSKVSRLLNDINTLEQFGAMVEKRRAELAAIPHDTEGNLLYRFDKPSAVSAAILFRESNTDIYGYNIERYLWVGHWGYLFKSGIANSDKDNLDHLVRIFNQLIPIDNGTPPKQAGFCIDGALVTGEVGRISVSPSVSGVLGMPGISLFVGSGENPNPPDGASITSAFDDLAEEQRRTRETIKSFPNWVKDSTYPKEFMVLRKRERSLNGTPGQEVVYRQQFNNDRYQYKFTWGDTVPLRASTPPSANIEMSFTDEEDPAKPAIPPPSEEKMFALWDAVLNSVRLRPGAY